jgi:hypothetical protein
MMIALMIPANLQVCTIHCWSTPALLGVVPQAVPSQQELYPLIRLVRGVEEDNADG